MPERVTLQEFAARLQPYRESVQAASDLLSDLGALHQEGGALTVQQRGDLLHALAALAQVYEGCRAVGGATNDVPLALVPGRLPLLHALIEAKAQTHALARRLATLALSPTRREVSDWWAMEQAIADTRQKNAAVADEVRHLMDRARFAERATYAKPRRHRTSSGRRGRVDQ